MRYHFKEKEVYLMTRVVKAPKERKEELLDIAMRLFAEKGYDNVSVRSVAREAGVASGLAYHYFESKQRMFDEAIGAYSRRCAEGACMILDDNSFSLDEKIDRAIDVMADHDAFPYREFFHENGEGTLHDRLSLGICEAVRPHLRSALELDAALRDVASDDADALSSMMVCACIGLASGPGMPDEKTVGTARRYLKALVAEFRR